VGRQRPRGRKKLTGGGNKLKEKRESTAPGAGEGWELEEKFDPEWVRAKARNTRRQGSGCEREENFAAKQERENAPRSSSYRTAQREKRNSREKKKGEKSSPINREAGGDARNR